MPLLTLHPPQIQNSKECGACALAAILSAFGRFDAPGQPARRLNFMAAIPLGKGKYLELDREQIIAMGGAEWDMLRISQIFRLSGMVEIDGSHVRYTNDVGDFYSPPSILMWIANQFSVTPTLLMLRGLDSVFGMMFPIELTLCQTMLAFRSEKPVAYETPDENSIDMIAVNQGKMDASISTPQHWVAFDGTNLYDPTSGALGPPSINLGGMGYGARFSVDGRNESLLFSGLWLRFTGTMPAPPLV